MPLPVGVSKGQALQLLLNQLDYAKPIFDSERDLLATDLMFVNKNGCLCNMSVSIYGINVKYLVI